MEEKEIKLWVRVSKQEYLTQLRNRAFEYNLTNIFMADSFLYCERGDEIFLYYTGGDAVPCGGVNGIKMYLEEKEEGVVIKGEFVVAEHIKFIIFSFLFFLWGGIIWFVFPVIYMGIIMIPIGVIVTSVIFLVVNQSEEISNKKKYIYFLLNMCERRD